MRALYKSLILLVLFSGCEERKFKNNCFYLELTHRVSAATSISSDRSETMKSFSTERMHWLLCAVLNGDRMDTHVGKDYFGNCIDIKSARSLVASLRASGFEFDKTLSESEWFEFQNLIVALDSGPLYEELATQDLNRLFSLLKKALRMEL